MNIKKKCKNAEFFLLHSCLLDIYFLTSRIKDTFIFKIIKNKSKILIYEN